MRRMSGITVQVDERWIPSGAPKAKRAAKRKAWRWPGPLRSALVRRSVAASVLALALAAGVALFPARQAVHRMLAWSGQAGFRVDDIFVEGRVKTPRDQLLAALGVSRGDAIFAVDLAAARHRIETIPWVRTAVVERRLPGQIHLVISERAPIALWQSKGRYFLVDRDGQIVGDQIDDYPDLPLTVGEGAPDHAAGLVALLGQEPALKARFKAATWIGDRRWNLMLDRTPDGIEVRLPEEHAEEAWHDLARLEADRHLLERQISVVDLRLPDRLVLRAAAGPREQADGAKRKNPNGKDA
jgi:cell division protein FtsQ